MPDVEVTEDTVQTPKVEETGQAAPSTEETASETELIFGKYRDMAEAAKGWDELNKTYGKQAQEMGSLRKELEQIKSQADQAAAIKELVETLKPKQEPKSPEWKSIEQQLVEEGWDEDEAKRQVRVMQINAAWQQQGEENVRTEYRSELEKVKAELAAEKQARVKLTPEYLENKELVDEMVEGGMAMGAAIAFARKLSEQLPAKAPSRTAPPPSVNGGRVTMEQQKAQVILTAEDKAAIAGGLRKTIEELEADGTFAKMEAEEKARRAVQ